MSRKRKRPTRRRREMPPVDAAAHAQAHEAHQWAIERLKIPITAGSPRRHHYVPQFLMQRFADDNQLVRLPLFDSDESASATHVKNLAVRKDFYTLTVEGVGDTAAVEEGLARLDSDACIAVERLTSAESLPPSPADQTKLTTWFSLLFFRGPRVRRMMEAGDSVAAKMMLTLNKPDVMASLPEQWEPFRHQNAYVTQMLRMVDEAAPLLLPRRWTLVKFSEPGIVLPDTPVVLSGSGDPHVGTGLATAQELLVPLDRQTILALHYYDPIANQVIEVEHSNLQDNFNRVLVAGAYEEVYCHPADQERISSIVAEPREETPLFFMDGGLSREIKADGVNAPPRRRRPLRHRQDLSR